MKLSLKVLLLTIGVLALLSIVLISRRGVKVEIVNLGLFAMQNVSVDVTGRSYTVGDIAAGASKWVQVFPSGESSVSVKFSDGKSKQRTLFIDTYIEDGYSGKLTAQVKNGKITQIKQRIKLTPVW